MPLATQAAATPGTSASADGKGELPLPSVPDTITVPAQRADYLMAHFWDAMDFADCEASLDTAYMEQNFVNFVQLYGYGTEEGARIATRTLLAEAAGGCDGAFALLQHVAVRYLNDPNSPMRNEDSFILFLEELLGMPGLQDADRIRSGHHLERARKNRPGTVAADFAYISREGVRKTLHGTGTPGRPLLLLFYDPDCTHCREILGRLRENGALKRLAAAGAVDVLAVYTDGDRSLWDRTKGDMPQEWGVGMDEDGTIQEKELYALPAMPVIYLLDGGRTVMAKDIPCNRLEAWLAYMDSRTSGNP